MKIKQKYANIKSLLEKDSRCKDNDGLLTVTIWWKELISKGIDPRKMTAFEFMNLYKESKLTSGATIVRLRSKAQRENINLRGKLYSIRKQKQNKVKTDIKTIK